MYKVCDKLQDFSQRLNKCSVFRLLQFIWKQFFLNCLWSIYFRFTQANEMVLWKWLLWRVHHRTIYTEIHKVFRSHLLLPSLILTLASKTERCDCSALNCTVNGKLRSQVFKLLFIYLFIDFHSLIISFITIHICWTIVICQGLC